MVLYYAGADPDSALELVIRAYDIEAARLCVKASADLRVIVDRQEACAARLAAARLERNSDDEDEYYDDNHPSDDESDAGWNDEIEALLRSSDHAT